MKYYIGIDGGATKTIGLISDLEGNILGRIETGPVNYHKESIELLEENISRNVSLLVSKINAEIKDIKRVAMGISGIDRPMERRMVREFLAKIGISKKTKIYNDAVIALKGGTKNGYGIVIISGTGSIVYGIDKDGKIKRVGGWGNILNDVGSGYDIGLRALRAVMASYDKKMPKTILTPLILKKLSLKDPSELVLWLDKCKNVKLDISQLSFQVFMANKKKDKAAKKILDQVTDDLCLGAKIIVKELKFKNSYEIVLSGGMFLKNLNYFEIMKKKLSKSLQSAKIIFPYHEPAYGALMIARGL